MSDATPRTRNASPLDRDEAELVERSRTVATLAQTELTSLVKRLRARRDRVQRMIRDRTRRAEGGKGSAGPDTGARDKKAALVEAIGRVTDELERRKTSTSATTATENLRRAVQAKSEATTWRGPEDRTADTGPAETPNTRIAPSGALHAEGMRAAISRSTGNR